MKRAHKTRHYQPEEEPLFQLGQWLKNAGYHFVTVTPATHARVLGRNPSRVAATLEDIFGWNLPFRPGHLPEPALSLLRQADALEETSGLLRSRIRFSTLGDDLYLHSGYPTDSKDAVFFGPDTYRFVNLIERALQQTDFSEIKAIADIGCGSGAGGIAAGKLLEPYNPLLILTDLNPQALRYAAINAGLAGLESYTLREGDLMEPVGSPLDIIVANPPFLVDTQARAYRHGGGKLGSSLSTRIVQEGLPRLAANGLLVLYTATPVVEGRDTFHETIAQTLQHPEISYEYREIDPDIFGEELETPAYAGVDRIAAVSVIIRVRNPIHSGIVPRARHSEPEVPALLSS